MKHFILFFFFIFSFMSSYCQTATFIYQYHNEVAKGGTFTFTDPAEEFTFSSPASAGYLGAANNPYYQLTKNTGPLPNGTWEIYELKNASKSIFRLRPTDDVNIPVDKDGKQIRDGFLIHGVGSGETPDQASTGCIILDPKYRDKLKSAFNKYGIIKLKVTNMVTGDGNTAFLSKGKKIGTSQIHGKSTNTSLKVNRKSNK
jgi:hypothetical protein